MKNSIAISGISTGLYCLLPLLSTSIIHIDENVIYYPVYSIMMLCAFGELSSFEIALLLIGSFTTLWLIMFGVVEGCKRLFKKV